MEAVVVFGLIASSGLVFGAIVGAYFDIPRLIVGNTLAFSSGALITALAFELFDDAFAQGGPIIAGFGLFLGATVFTLVDWLVDEHYGGDEASGIALAASVTLDGVPENTALGIELIGATGPGPFALLAAIFASNLPEALDSSEFLVEEGRSKQYAVGLWIIVGGVLLAAVVVGNVLFADADETTLAFVRSFAGGAVLAAIADEILPEAYERGGPAIALATTAGFFLTFLLK